MPDTAAESAVLRAWAEGSLTPDGAFEQLYVQYGPLVHGWLAVRADAADADDLYQEVWAIFCRRWREWKPAAGLDVADARPVLSFLFRTCHLVLMAHRLMVRTRATEPIEDADPPAVDGHEVMTQRVQLGECLAAARACCTDEDRAVLTAKLSGVPAREIARTLGMTESAVDHRHRNAVASIREHLTRTGSGTQAPQLPRSAGHHD